MDDSDDSLDVEEIVNRAEVDRANGKTDLHTSRWREEFLNTKNAERWMARTLGHSDESLCKLLRLEDELKLKYGKSANLIRDDAGQNQSYCEAVKNNAWEDPKPQRKSVGDFEKHTRGFGSKVMASQGWDGVNGLGNGRSQSIKEPVEAKGKPSGDKQGMGFNTEGHEMWLTPRPKKEHVFLPQKSAPTTEDIPTQNRFKVLEDDKQNIIEEMDTYTIKRGATEEPYEAGTSSNNDDIYPSPQRKVAKTDLPQKSPTILRKGASYTPPYDGSHDHPKRVTISANPTLIPDGDVRAKTKSISPSALERREPPPDTAKGDGTEQYIKEDNSDLPDVNNDEGERFRKWSTTRMQGEDQHPEKLPSGSSKRKFQQADKDFWGRPRIKVNIANKKIEVCKICKSEDCHDHTVAALENEEEGNESMHFHTEEKVDNLLEHGAWPTLPDDHRIKEKPSINEPDSEKGSRHRLVSIINGYCVILTLDTGSFASIMSLPRARSLKLEITELEEAVSARSATGPMKLTHFCEVPVDLGTIKCKMKFLLIDNGRWKDDLVLIGSNTLKALNMEIYFKEHLVKIHGILPVPMHNSSCSASEYIQKIKSSYLSLSAIRIRFKGEMTIRPFETRRIDVFLNDMDVVTLSNTIVFFKGVQTRNNLIFNDLLIEKDYPWKTEPLKVTVSNPDPVPHDIRYGDKIGTLKPLINRHLLQQLPGLDLEDEVYLIEDMGDGMVEENTVAVLEEGEIVDDPKTEELEKSIDAFITKLESSTTTDEKNKSIMKQVLTRAKAMLKTEDNHLVPEFREPNSKSKAELDEFFRIPESVRSEINLHHGTGNKISGTRLTTRDDLSPDEVDALVEESQQQRDMRSKNFPRN